jgi:AcrR family transcriptional regulator
LPEKPLDKESEVQYITQLNEHSFSNFWQLIGPGVIRARKVSTKPKVGRLKFESILKEAKRLFWFKGFDRTSVREIATACGCTQGNIYNHFSSKEGILYKVLLSEMTELIDAIQSLENDYNTSPVEQLRVFIERHVEHALAPARGELLLFEMEMGHLCPSHRVEIIQWRDSYDRILRKIVRRGVDAGVFAEVNEKLVNYAISSTILRARLWYSPKGELSLSQLSNAIFELFLMGLGLRQRPSRRLKVRHL